jgi:hypothetical protein
MICKQIGGQLRVNKASGFSRKLASGNTLRCPPEEARKGRGYPQVTAEPQESTKDPTKVATAPPRMMRQQTLGRYSLTLAASTGGAICR